MADSRITKRALAASLKELIERTPLAKISVGDITKNCGLNRQTFYYHFNDKFDLVNWIYATEAAPYLEQFSNREHWVEGLCALCGYMQQNSKFYINALEYSGQNSFQDYLSDIAHQLVRTMADELVGGRMIDDAEMEFIADFYACAFVGLIMKWARHGMREKPEDYIDRARMLVEGSLQYEMGRR